MASRRKLSAEPLEKLTVDHSTVARVHLAHIASLREARAHHKAITLGLRTLFDTVAAEAVPEGLLNALNDKTEGL